MASFNSLYGSFDPDPDKRGKQFERFVKWFLTVDPEWSTQVAQVWLWDQWPGRWGRDCGIDLVFRDKNGQIWAVQAKCYAPEYVITKSDVDKFLSESNRREIDHRLLIATTDGIGANAKQVCKAQEKSVVIYLRTQLDNASVEYPDDLTSLSTGKWKEGFAHLDAFVQAHGHCRVPTSHVTDEDYRLGRWVGWLRANRDSMSANRKSRLDALSFTWDSFSAQWEEGFQNLEAFVTEHGHFRVPGPHVTSDGYRLGQWVSTQRRTRDSMSADRKSRLDALDFIWDPVSEQWEIGFQHLEAFVNEHGHCRVPKRHLTEDGYRLGKWVGRQRANLDSMSADRKLRLDALDFVWKVGTSANSPV